MVVVFVFFEDEVVAEFLDLALGFRLLFEVGPDQVRARFEEAQVVDLGVMGWWGCIWGWGL